MTSRNPHCSYCINTDDGDRGAHDCYDDLTPEGKAIQERKAQEWKAANERRVKVTMIVTVRATDWATAFEKASRGQWYPGTIDIRSIEGVRE